MAATRVMVSSIPSLHARCRRGLGPALGALPVLAVLPVLAALLWAAADASPAWAQATAQPALGDPLGTTPSTKMPDELADVGFDQRLGAALPLDLAFTDEAGQAVHLGDYFGKRPVLLLPVYYDCPMLCGQVINGVVAGLGTIPFLPGREYEVVAVSFDPRDTVESAGKSKNTALGRFGHREAAGGWHFLTGSPESIRRFTEAIGFRYRFDEGSGQFAHTAGAVMATPEGRVSRYFFGIEFPGRDLRLGMVEASSERIGSVVDHVFLYCFRYNPTTGKYSALTMNIVRLAGGLTVALIALGLVVSLARERRRANPLGTA